MKTIDTLTMYTCPTALGICVNVRPDSLAASVTLDIIEPLIDKCHMPECNEDAVRVAIYGVELPGNNGRVDSEFRGLCERHKCIGMW